MADGGTNVSMEDITLTEDGIVEAFARRASFEDLPAAFDAPPATSCDGPTGCGI
jgi:hypothetical protein